VPSSGSFLAKRNTHLGVIIGMICNHGLSIV
jgi:hypothetical protein